ncbi:MAG: hypothetical protein ABW346_09945 [Terrimicrobium sp.]
MSATISTTARSPSTAQPPIEAHSAVVRPPSKRSAGLMGVLKALQHIFGQMRPYAAIQALRKINQKDGFNCQSCAWPSPDHERSFAEFCENGAKAVAHEGTKKQITPEFFSRYSVAELQTKSEHWLGHQGRLTSPMILREGASHYEPIEWAAAFNQVAAALNQLRSSH